MNRNPDPHSAVFRESLSGIECATLTHPDHSEIHLVAQPQPGESVCELYGRTVALCTQRRADLVSMTVFLPPDEPTSTKNHLLETRSEIASRSWPVTWLCAAPQAGGIVAYALKNARIHPLIQDGVAVGSRYDIADVRYCRLAGIVAPQPDAAPAIQAAEVFDRMEALLRASGLRFQDVIRTWFFNADILSWYDEFNRVRDNFFAARGIRGDVAPASTGIGIANHHESALAGELLAVVGDASVKKTVVPSPLQCSAVDYGSSFSRALELETAYKRTLYVSGTASISPDGRTEFVGDPAGQIGRTMEVVKALLYSRGMSWADASRAIAFFKDISNLPVFLAYCDRNGLGPLPCVSVRADVCRPDLLFELEFEAAVCE